MFLGLDLSLSDSGISLINEDGSILILESIKSKRVGDKIEERFARYYSILNQIRELIIPYIEKIKGIAIEMFSYGSQGRIVQLAESATLVRDLILRNKNKDSFIIEVSPISLKKFILGKVKAKGQQSKNLIIKEIYKKYDVDINNDNIADAFILSQIVKMYHDKKYEFEYQKEVIENLIKANE
jgi:Holliday junction resolvasome RuvABC endonuclease subunit